MGLQLLDDAFGYILRRKGPRQILHPREQLAAFASNQTALALSLLTSGLRRQRDRTGRRKLLLVSLVGVVLSLGVLAAATARFDASPARTTDGRPSLQHPGTARGA
jgi:hypothetical protein